VKNVFAPTSSSLLHHMPFFFSVINVNSILSLNQMKTTSISNSSEQLCLGQHFASGSSLAGVS